MNVVLTGFDLTIEDVVRVARHDGRVAFHRDAVARMRAARRIVMRALERGDAVYGTTTGVAAKKRDRVQPSEAASFNRLLLESHRVGQGADAPRDVVRAAMLRMANGFARGTTTASPELAGRLISALNEGLVPRVRLLGSVGVGDLTANADLGHAVLGGHALGAGEALALVGNNAFSTALAALAVADAGVLLRTFEVAGALDLEAFAANVSILDPAVAEARPHAGHRAAAKRLRELLSGSTLWKPGAARNLQDPLTFRGMPQVLGAARDALAHVEAVVAAELNAAQDNPLVDVEGKKILSVWNGEILSIAAALDYLRIVLASVVTAANERTLKLLQAPLSGLPGGLAARGEGAEDALAELGVAVQAIAAEARLLAQPVSFEIASTTQAEGIEDRTTMAPLAARRLAEMCVLGARVCAIELTVAAQAVDLRRHLRLGRGTARAHAAVREIVPMTGAFEAPPIDLEPLVARVRDGALSAPDGRAGPSRGKPTAARSRRSSGRSS